MKRLSPADSAKIARANRDYTLVLEKMERRKLLASGNHWQGVEWAQDGSEDIVLFAFESFDYPVVEVVAIQDITTGTMIFHSGNLNTEAMHTYLIGGTVVGVQEVKPFDYQLSQNYPNPFNPETIIKYQLSAAAPAKLSIHNVLGQQIRLLVDEFQHPGKYQVQWKGINQDGMRVSSGVYFYKLESGDFVEVRKMLLLR